MKSRVRHPAVLAALLVTLLVAACSSDAGPGGTYTRPETGDQDVADTDPDDQGTSDQGVPDQTTPDQGLPDDGVPDPGTPDPDAASDGDGTVLDVGPDCEIDTSGRAIPSEYLETDGSPRDVRIIIEAVDFTNDVIFIRNVTNLTGSNETIDFSDAWRVAHNTSGATLIGARDLPPGGRMRIHLRKSGFNRATDTYLNLGGSAFDLTACGGELAIQDRTGQDTLEWSNRPGNIEAFVRWGNRNVFASASATFNDEAFDAGVWLIDYLSPVASVLVCWGDDENASWCSQAAAPCVGMANDQAIIAVGDVRDPEDWYSAPASEFVGCP
jgi:hypothetical protein